MYKLAEEFGVRTFDVNTKGKTIFSYGGKVTPYKSPFLPPLNPLALVDAGLLINAFDKLSQTVNLEEPWEAKHTKRLDMMTLDEWVRAHGWTNSAKDMMRMACELIWAVSKSQISMLQALWYCKAGVSFTDLSIENGAQQQLVMGGAQTLANRIKDKLGEVVKPKEPVAAVDQSAENVVLVTRRKGSYRARCVIMAIPPQLILPSSSHHSCLRRKSNCFRILRWEHIGRCLLATTDLFGVTTI
jgi:monoamine oxidase